MSTFENFLASRERSIDRRLTTKPSPKAFGIGDEVVVTYPPSKFFKKTGTVTDLNYLESSARKGYGDYSVSVEFPGGEIRKFLMGRVRAVSILSQPGIEKSFELSERVYGKAKARLAFTRRLKRKYGEEFYKTSEYLEGIKEYY